MCTNTGYSYRYRAITAVAGQNGLAGSARARRCRGEGRLMARPDTVTEEDIQEYIDGRASPALRADVETFLAVRTHRKAEVQALIRQQEALRRLGTEILAEPLPERLKLGRAHV